MLYTSGELPPALSKIHFTFKDRKKLGINNKRVSRRLILESYKQAKDPDRSEINFKINYKNPSSWKMLLYRIL